MTTARNVRLEPDDDTTDLSVRSGETAIGAVSETQPGQSTLVVDVPDDAEAGTYSVNVDVSYSYTYQQSSSGVTYDRTASRTKTIDLVVDDDARFELVSATTDAQVGDSGTLEAVVENTGDETAHDVSVALESLSGGLVFGESAQDTARIDELEAGETTTVTYDVSVAPDTTQRQYTLDGTVQFRTEDGLQRVDDSPSVGVIPQAEQQFSLSDIESDLYVGEDGDLHGTVTNVGPNHAENVVVRYTDESPNVVPIETAVAVGTLEAGESETFRLPLEISGEAEAVDRAIDLAVQYRNSDFEQRLYEDLEIVTSVSAQRDQFLVDVQDRELAAGEEKHVDVEITNNLDQTVTDVEARLFASDPLDSDDDEAFIQELEPGESTTMTFALEADPTATAKTYPISFDFRYDDERGTSKLSDTTRVAIDVTESEGGLPLTLIGVIVLTGLGAGAYVYQRS
ncbi:exo-alpha-sialidase [Salinadaptatus halalkaliphilus]|uniref:Exo-alpha-sialidase n=1 Tax=Salinadaptatus halalkaliphilus TaxID=2419781 RepID=A0A4V3VLF5_9EURY|nr:exo-alpha-sialidase [Salinadaptatus halalkaliphilus]